MNKLTIDNIETTITDFKPNLKPSSVKQYLCQSKKLYELFGEKDFMFLNDPESVQNKVAGNSSSNNVKNKLNACIVILQSVNERKELIADYIKRRDDLEAEYVKQQETGIKSKKQQENMCTVAELKTMLNTMKSDIRKSKVRQKDNLTWMDRELGMVYTIFSILVDFPIRNDMAGMRLVNKTTLKKMDDNYNYLLNENGSFSMIINDYKTNKTKEKQGEDKTNIIPLNKEIDKVIRSHLRLFNIKNGDYMFINKSSEPYTRNAISNLLLRYSKKYLNKNISTCMIRHIVPSDRFGETNKEQKALAKVMMHSVATNIGVYVKHD